MTGMDELKEAQRAREAKADLAEILERRPDLKGKSIEAVRRVLRRERASIARTSKNLKNTKVNPDAPAAKREAKEDWGRR